MSEHGDKPPTDVLRTKRLEIVDDEGKVRATLGTDEEETTSLSAFDSSNRIRFTLNAAEAPEKASGLGVFDANGKLRASVGMSSDPEGSSFLTLLDADGKQRVAVRLRTGGQAGLRISAAQEDRGIEIAAGDDGYLYLMLGERDTPMAGFRLADEEGSDLSSELMLFDKDARSGVIISGRRSGPFVRLRDRREKVRGSYELGVGGVPRLFVFDEEGKPVD
jgi:hypothetical protein